MFNKYTTKFLIKLVNVLEYLVAFIFKSINKKQQNTIELAENTENNQDGYGEISEDADINEQILYDWSEDRELQSSHIKTQSQSKDQTPNREVINKNKSLIQDGESYDARESHEQTFSEPVMSSYRNQKLSNESETQTVSTTVNIESMAEHKQAEYSDSYLSQNTDNNKTTEDLHTFSNSAEVATKHREKAQVKEKTKNKVVTEFVSPEKINSQKILLEKNESGDLSTDTSGLFKHTKDCYKSDQQPVSATPVTPPSVNENSPLVAEAMAANKQYNKRRDASSSQHIKAPTSTTLSDYSTQHEAPTPVKSESPWPTLSGEIKQNNESLHGMTETRWPELPIETIETELSLQSTKSALASMILVKEIERIRNLEEEQKGMLWNA